MGRRLPTSIKAVVCLISGALLMAGCEPRTDSQGAEPAPRAGGGAPATTGSCQTGYDCNRPCRTSADCDTTFGRVCGAFESANRSPVQTDPTRADRSLKDEDAGAAPDPDMSGGPSGLCTSRCDTHACPAGMVCSATGVCVDGCDRVRPERCTADEFCDFERRACFAMDGSCKSDADCPRFDSLMDRGTVSCTLERCRFEPTFGVSSAAKLASPMPRGDLLPVVVQRPALGERITDIDAFTFQFSVPSNVMVVSILLDNDFKDLTDAAAAALWTAYLDRATARAGVSIRDGGAVRDGAWLAEPPHFPLDRPLYFLALGYDKGRLVAQSDVIPFMIGRPLPRPGDACGPLFEGQFCGEASGLICIEGTCRTPCLSHEDCAAEELRCLKPGVYAVEVRVCG